jgi:hypothetical protein
MVRAGHPGQTWQRRQVYLPALTANAESTLLAVDWTQKGVYFAYAQTIKRCSLLPVLHSYRVRSWHLTVFACSSNGLDANDRCWN